MQDTDLGHPKVLTVGHSTHDITRFLALLDTNGVAALVDVRSSPYSRYSPQYNREALEQSLGARSIRYLYLGDALGGRSRSAADYADGRVQYQRLAASATFIEAINRVIIGSKNYRIALMCAEREPLECHRTLLVGRELMRRGVSVGHIHADGRVETDRDAMARLLRIHGMQETGLFDSPEELIDRACELQEKRVAYVDPQQREHAAADLA